MGMFLGLRYVDGLLSSIPYPVLAILLIGGIALRSRQMGLRRRMPSARSRETGH